MRNWNVNPSAITTPTSGQLVAYLWGIETPRRFCDQQWFLISSLPMRNWNCLGWGTMKQLQYEVKVAYPWGTETILIWLRHHQDRVSSLPEELEKMIKSEKLTVVPELVAYLWGIETDMMSVEPRLRLPVSKPTYEELKRDLRGMAWSLSRLVAYLWGIETASLFGVRLRCRLS